jgi:hypothetical protein
MFSSIKRLRRQSGIHGPIASWRRITVDFFFRYCQHNVKKEMVKCLRVLEITTEQQQLVFTTAQQQKQRNYTTLTSNGM